MNTAEKREIEAFILDVLDAEAAYEKQIDELEEKVEDLQAEIYRRWLAYPGPFVGDVVKGFPEPSEA